MAVDRVTVIFETIDSVDVFIFLEADVVICIDEAGFDMVVKLFVVDINLVFVKVVVDDDMVYGVAVIKNEVVSFVVRLGVTEVLSRTVELVNVELGVVGEYIDASFCWVGLNKVDDLIVLGVAVVFGRVVLVIIVMSCMAVRLV